MIRVPIDREEIAAFCRRRHIQRLALFGSVLRDDFTPGFLSPYIRERIQREVRVLYDDDR